MIERFRSELRSWLEEHFTEEIRDAVRHESRDSDEGFTAHRAWNATLVDAG